MSEAKIVCAGFGGQGVMSMGRLLAYTGMLENREVSWLPSYGPEMRGGTANCHVIVSEHPVGSPIIHKDATAALVMNLPSVRKFEPELVPGGLLVLNRSLIDVEPERSDIDVLAVDANEIAAALGNAKVANMVMLGAYLAKSGLFDLASVEEALKKVFGPKKAAMLPLNEAALERGAAAVVEEVR
ncbi:MAG: 2-oxoacid:acceptor oxidoreductase family protein [Spirochaetales bacterium]|nr:2-oxoacid:acceptor oxidoreductase family protein [Spirochaetales bacterium]